MIEAISHHLSGAARKGVARSLKKHPDLSVPESQEALWNDLRKVFSKHETPLEVQWYLYENVYRARKPEHGPAPAWIPTTREVRKSNVGRIMREKGFANYHDFHSWSKDNREAFWELMLKKAKKKLKRRPSKVMDLPKGVESVEWLAGAKMNCVDSCFQAPKGATAVVWSAEGSKDAHRVTYGELERLVNNVASALKAFGLREGDSVAIDMPMNYESVAVYLGIVKAGMVAATIADSFAPPEIGKRVRIANAKAVFTVDYYIRSGKKVELYSKVSEASAPRAIVLPWNAHEKPALRQGDVQWSEFLAGGANEFKAVHGPPSAFTTYLYSSGTTGEPKAIPWTHLTAVKACVDAFLHQDIKKDDVLAWPTNLGWMMGPWLIFAALMNRATIALFVGAPLGREFGEFVQDAKVTMLGVIPSTVNAWKASKCMEGLDWKGIRKYSSTGECSKKQDMFYLMALAGYKPVIEYCGGTEIGGGYITGVVVKPASPSTFSTPALGLDFQVLDEKGEHSPKGEVFMVPPSIGLSQFLLNKDHNEVYYKGCPKGPNGEVLRRHGDQVEELAHGYFVVHGRIDEIGRAHV